MSNKTKWRFQVSLATCILAMIAAGPLIGLNVNANKFIVLDGLQSNSWNVTHFYFDRLCSRGWPWPYLTNSDDLGVRSIEMDWNVAVKKYSSLVNEETAWEDVAGPGPRYKSMTILERREWEKPVPFKGHWELAALAGDSMVAIALLISFGVIIEILIRL